jgi:hypothetical protein
MTFERRSGPFRVIRLVMRLGSSEMVSAVTVGLTLASPLALAQDAGPSPTTAMSEPFRTSSSNGKPIRASADVALSMGGGRHGASRPTSGACEQITL